MKSYIHEFMLQALTLEAHSQALRGPYSVFPVSLASEGYRMPDSSGWLGMCAANNSFDVSTQRVKLRVPQRLMYGVLSC